MIKKDGGEGTSSDIKWTVTLNNGDIKTDMNGYTFTDTLDENQTYTGEYVVYKGLYGENKIADGNLDGSTDKTFSYTFSGLSDADKYQPYRIVYHTQMKDQDSYDTVRQFRFRHGHRHVYAEVGGDADYKETCESIRCGDNRSGNLEAPDSTGLHC